jgi:hypothetical protein
MNGVWSGIRLAGCAVLLAGCISPKYTRFPTLRPSDPVAERESFNYHNPLPNPANGSPTIERPRGFENQRAEPRRAIEVDAITNGITGASGEGTSNNPSASRYPATVNP